MAPDHLTAYGDRREDFDPAFPGPKIPQDLKAPGSGVAKPWASVVKLGRDVNAGAALGVSDALWAIEPFFRGRYVFSLMRPSAGSRMRDQYRPATMVTRPSALLSDIAKEVNLK